MIDEQELLAGSEVAFSKSMGRLSKMTGEWQVDRRYSGLSSPIVRELEITKVVQTMRGRSGASLIQANDGHHYVAKFKGNPKGTPTLVNELLGSLILRALGLPAAEGVTLRLNETTLLEGEWPVVGTADGIIRAEAGLHFGSAFPGKFGTDAVYDYLPRSMRDSVTNREALSQALFVDTWLGLSEPRQAVFTRHGQKQFRLTLVDNTMIFGGSSWNFAAHTLQARYFDHSFYHGAALNPSVAPIAQIVDLLTTSRSEIVQQVPKEWLTGNDLSLHALLDELIERTTLFGADRNTSPAKAPKKPVQSEGWVGGESSDSASLSAKCAMEAAS